MSKVARPPNKSQVEYALDVLLGRQARSAGRAQNVVIIHLNKHIHKSSQIPQTKVIPPILFLNIKNVHNFANGRSTSHRFDSILSK